MDFLWNQVSSTDFRLLLYIFTPRPASLVSLHGDRFSHVLSEMSLFWQTVPGSSGCVCVSLLSSKDNDEPPRQCVLTCAATHLPSFLLTCWHRSDFPAVFGWNLIKLRMWSVIIPSFTFVIIIIFVTFVKPGSTRSVFVAFIRKNEAVELILNCPWILQ